MMPFDVSGKKHFENIVGKGEIVCTSNFPTMFSTNKQFLLFPQSLLLYQRQKLSFLLDLICRLQMLSIWSGPKFCRVGMG